MSELHIPDESVSALLAIESDWENDDELYEAIREIAAPIVAAELQRIADEHRETNDGGDVVSALDERSYELGGGTA